MRFKIKKCEVSISFYFAAAVCLMLIPDHENIVLGALAASLFHEAGHLTALFVFHAPPEKIEFRIFGFRITAFSLSLGYKKDIAVALAGPLFNFFLFAVLGLLRVNGALPYISLLIGCFNLLPILPLDGANAALAFLNQNRDEKTALHIMKRISLLFCIPLLLSGIYIFVKTGYNMSLLILAAYLILCYNK